MHFRQILKNRTVDFAQQNIWNVIFGIPWTIFYKNLPFWRNTHGFCWNREFLTNFWPKIVGCCSSCVPEKRRFVYRNACKITVPAGLAWHVCGKKCKSLWIIWCTDMRFRQIPKNQSADFEQQNTWNVIIDTFFTKTCYFWRNYAFLVETHNSWAIPDPKR